MLEFQSREPDWGKYLWAQGHFQRPTNYTKLAITGLPDGEVSTALSCSQLPLPLVGMADCRGDGNSRNKAPKQQLLYYLFSTTLGLGTKPK